MPAIPLERPEFQRSMPLPTERLSPFVPSPPQAILQMLELARVGPSDRLFDLGSGDGRIVVMAAQRFGADATGIELDPELVNRSSAQIFALGLDRLARIVRGNILDADLRNASVVTLYQLSSVNEQLRPSLEQQLSPGARVVSLDFPVPGWKPQKLLTGILDDGRSHAIYLYTIQMEDSMPIAAANRSYATGSYGIELDGLSADWVQSAEGGHATGDVVTEKIGPDRVVHKHLAGVKYEDITVNCGAGMSKGFYEWIKTTFALKGSPQNGAVVMTSPSGQAESRLEFYNSLVTEVGFPALDASSKEACSLTIRFAPEFTRYAKGGGKVEPKIATRAVQKPWLRSNFRLQIADLDCTKVNKIDGLTVRQVLVQLELGVSRSYQKESSHLEIPNLVVTLPDAAAQSFYDWHEDFVIKGNSDKSREKSGTLEFLAPNLQDVLFKLTLSNLGIFSLKSVPSGTSTATIRQVQAEMYCEQISFEYSSAVGVVEQLEVTEQQKPVGVLPSAAAEQWKLRAPISVTPATEPVARNIGTSLRFRT
jgi:SAM-dependent methyltransferase